MFPKICWMRGESRRRSELRYFSRRLRPLEGRVNRSSDRPQFPSCARCKLSRRKQIIEEHFGAISGEEDWSPRYNIASTQPVAVIRQNPKEPTRELSLMRWGLIPRWAKDSSAAAANANEYGRSPRARGQQLSKHVPYCLRPVLSSLANQSVRTLESLGALHFHFPVVICTRPNN
jgi:hypothetical protein